MPPEAASVAQALEDGAMRLAIGGRWHLGQTPVAQPLLDRLRGCRALHVTVAPDTEWDSSLPAFLTAVLRVCARHGVPSEVNAPQRLRALLTLATAQPPLEEVAAPKRVVRLPDLRPALRYIGHLWLALRPVRALPQARELLRIARQCSNQTLPIVLLVNFLVGAILAFIGAVQLREFGAEIFVADLVGIATAREMAALITAVVLSGRIAAAFAAEIATMQGNEEIDALRTVQVDVVRYLALPRVCALLLATPVLFAAAVLATLGGAVAVATAMLDIPAAAFLLQTREAVELAQFGIGFTKAMCFHAFLAAAGCYYGLGAQRTAAAVGAATTRAVVSSIVGIICIDAAFAIATNALGI